MTQPSDQERRQHERFPQLLDVHVQGLLSSQTTGSVPKEFDGRIHNLSNGGVCIISSSPLQADTFVRCSLHAVDSPVSIPTFMQVRWTAKHRQKPPSYISGLQFVA